MTHRSGQASQGSGRRNTTAAPDPSRRTIVGRTLAIAALAPVLPGCGQGPLTNRASKDFNFRQTITADFEGQTITSSSVQNFYWRGWSTELASVSRTVYSVDGEGVVFDFGRGGVVVSTIIELAEPVREAARTPQWGLRPPLRRGWPVASFVAKDLIGPRGEDVSLANWWLPLADMTSSRDVELSLGQLPLLLWIRDRTNPASVEKLDVSNAQAGEPSIVSSTVSVTNDPMTRGVVSGYLPWVEEYRDTDRHLSGNYGAIKSPDVSDNILAQDVVGYFK